jgi:2-amino-4-hydroxy-6-hydroxymethyldihydropteridine diphosphokinase
MSATAAEAEAEAGQAPHVRAFLALGSNLGGRLENLRRAVELLDATPGIRVERTSSVYETDPVGPPQPDYLNAVAEVHTTLTARALLEACLGVEHALGRVRGERWGPRTLDVDLLTYGEERIDEPGLTVPHPRMHERAFVLIPLRELEPDPPLPDGRSIDDVRIDDEGVRRFGPPLATNASSTS